jgi:hypothetical protein
MKKIIAIGFLFLTVAGVAVAEMYRLGNVRRLDSNVYKADGGLIIKTKYCYHYAYGEDAIYDDDDNKIIWKDGDTPCEVAGIYK